MQPIRTLALAAILLSSSPAMSADPAYVGTWGVSAAQCKVPQERQGAPMIVTLKGYDQHETHCTFRQMRKSGDGWSVKTSCMVEGDRQAHAFHMTVAADVLTVRQGKVARAYRRCR